MATQCLLPPLPVLPGPPGLTSEPSYSLFGGEHSTFAAESSPDGSEKVSRGRAGTPRRGPLQPCQTARSRRVPRGPR